MDSHYPTVDKNFIEQQIRKNNNILESVTIGSSTAYVLVGSKPVMKRTYLVRELEPGVVDYYSATGLAIKLGFMGALLDWFEQNRNWKDGAYVVSSL